MHPKAKNLSAGCRIFTGRMPTTLFYSLDAQIQFPLNQHNLLKLRTVRGLSQRHQGTEQGRRLRTTYRILVVNYEEALHYLLVSPSVPL